jgi:serine/threonine protein kinase
MPKRPGKALEKIFSKASPEAIDLLKKLLTFDMKKRITVNEALQHPYLSELHFPEDEV